MDVKHDSPPTTTSRQRDLNALNKHSRLPMTYFPGGSPPSATPSYTAQFCNLPHRRCGFFGFIVYYFIIYRFLNRWLYSSRQKSMPRASESSRLSIIKFFFFFKGEEEKGGKKNVLGVRESRLSGKRRNGSGWDLIHVCAWKCSVVLPSPPQDTAWRTRSFAWTFTP